MKPRLKRMPSGWYQCATIAGPLVIVGIGRDVADAYMSWLRKFPSEFLEAVRS